jgi:endonuclease G
VVFVCGDDIGPKERFPLEWFQVNSPEHQRIKSAIQAVGQIQFENESDLNRIPGSVGFLIAPGIFLTTAWSRSEWEKLPRGRALRQALSVEFAKSAYNEPSRRFPVSKILYNGDNPGSSVCLLKLASQANQRLPKPLPLQVTMPSYSMTGEAVCVVGHPQLDHRNEPKVFAQVFPPPYGVKRLALGAILGEEQFQKKLGSSLGEEGLRNRVLHDCSTSGGDGGAPLVSLPSGKVLGMHIGGMYLNSNYARSIWSILAIPEIGELVLPVE